MKAFVAVAAVAAVLALPGAMAIVSTHDITGPLVPAEAGEVPVFYIAEDGSLWQESNGIPGLQVSETQDEDGNTFAADTFVAGPQMLPPL